MKKLQVILTLDDDYPVDQLRDIIESEGITIESMYDIPQRRRS